MIPGDNPCRWCVGACCRNPEIIEIDFEEYRTLIEADTELDLLAVNGADWEGLPVTEYAPEGEDKILNAMARTLKTGRALARFVSICGYLDSSNNTCTIRGEDQQPSACIVLTPGSYGCNKARTTHGVMLEESKVVLKQRPNWADPNFIDRPN